MRPSYDLNPIVSAAGERDGLQLSRPQTNSSHQKNALRFFHSRGDSGRLAWGNGIRDCDPKLLGAGVHRHFALECDR